MFLYTKLAHKVVRCFGSTAAVLSKSHYDALGITPKATQADVKAAYYRLSMIYHPDKNKESVDASDKFKDITAAYEVLGNVKLRRLYDKGMIHVSAHATPETAEEDPKAGFYRSREQRTRPPPATGKTPIYDFDEWARAHYGATFARDMEIKRRRQMQKRIDEQSKEDTKMETILAGIMVLLMVFMYATSDTKEDIPVYRRASDNSIPSKIEK